MRISLHEMDILMSFVLRKPKEFVYAHPTYTLSKSQVKKFDTLVQRREQGEPIAYLTGHKEFYGLDFLVNKAVLIPRPSTETLIETVLPALKSKQLICDVGTGSGNIALTLKYLKPNCVVIATDVSASALQVAKQNAKRLKTTVRFYRSNVLRQLPKSLRGKIDIITFNAPYLTKQEASKANLQYEPRIALTPTGSPTSLIEQLLQQASTFLKPTGQIYFEIGHRQAKQVARLCQKYFPAATITVIKDLGGWDRVVHVTLPHPVA
ncbi:MAG: peptide chain release factor N(5)-glutamine methyltransferase [Candidatus Kerfeldbacteria bacterium]|nr:peptide chain release factor N(5)-glutamine methyltransferase [Candidatus Kerfeldbacteria bacterium]